MQRLFLHILGLSVLLSAAFARPVSTSSSRTRPRGTITRFSERQPSTVSEKLASYFQGMMLTLHSGWDKGDTHGKDIFTERELEGPIYISVHGLPPPAYSAHDSVVGVTEQRKMVMEIAGLGNTLD